MGRIPYFSVQTNLLLDVFQFGFLGLGCAGAAVALYEGVRVAELLLRPLPRTLSAPLGGALCGIIALKFPQARLAGRGACCLSHAPGRVGGPGKRAAWRALLLRRLRCRRSSPGLALRCRVCFMHYQRPKSCISITISTFQSTPRPRPAAGPVRLHRPSNISHTQSLHTSSMVLPPHAPLQVQYGYINLEEIFRDTTTTTTSFLSSLLAAKIAATAVCVGGGLVGGLFAPSLFLGALVRGADGAVACWHSVSLAAAMYCTLLVALVRGADGAVACSAS